MARAAQTAAQGASTQYQGNATGALNNYNAEISGVNDQINALGVSDPYTSKTYLQNQNLLTSAATNANNTAGAQKLNDTALRTGTNTAALAGTIAENARSGQRLQDQYNAGTATENQDKYLQLEQGLIGDRQNAANSEGQIYGTSAGGQQAANSDLVNLNGQQDQLFGNIIGGAAGGLGSAFSGKA